MPPKPLLSATLTPADFPNLRFPLFASPKIDGIRALAHRSQLFSRTGKLIPNLFIQRWANDLSLHGWDGELVVGLPNVPETYKATRGPVMAQGGEPDFKYYVFDNWEKDAPYRSRIICEKDGINLLPLSPKIIPVPQRFIANTDELLCFESDAIACGYEGIMLRQPFSLYKPGRSTLREQILMKLKRFVDDEAVIIGWEERMHNANELQTDAFGYAKRSDVAAGLVPCGDLGAWKVRMATGPFSGIECKVGTGFTSRERQELWAIRDTLLGQTCVVKWFPPGSDKAPRLPTWKGLRTEGE
jgi:DNA ligase-1